MARGDSSVDPHYQVVARRFRPRTFGELVGQAAILKSLRGALTSGRVPHAFLFSGSRGVGKTTMARILARCLNCETGVTAEPCGKCGQCTSILDGTNGDVMEIDAASHNLVDDIRELRERVGFASMGGRYKVYILDEVHMLTRNAFNAFLKTLEEPPARVVFILATTELHKVPETIRSRCQVLLFQRMDEADIVQRLRTIAEGEGLQLPDEVLLEIARGARGGMRDSETALERILPVAQERGAAFTLEDYRQLVHSTGADRVTEAVATLLMGKAAPALHFVADLVASGADEREVLGEILEVLRALLLLAVDGPDSGLVSFTGDLRARLQELAAGADVTRLDAMVQAGLRGRERIRLVDDRRLVLELTMVRMAEAGRLPELAELLEQVRAVGLTGTGPPSPGTGAPAAATGAPVTNTSGSLKARLLAACAQRKGMLSRTLELCTLGEPGDDRKVRLTLQTDFKLHRDRLQAPGLQREIRDMIAEILGHPIELEVTFERSPGAVAEPSAPAKVSVQVEPGPGVRKVVERFDGKILNVESPTE